MEFRNDYTDDDNYTHIDYWSTDNDSEVGRTIAIVCRDTKKVYYIDNGFISSAIVRELIEETLNEI